MNKCIHKGIDYKGKIIGCYDIIDYSHLQKFPSQSKSYWKVRCIHCNAIKTVAPQRVVYSDQRGCSSCKKIRFAKTKSHLWKSEANYVTGMYFQKLKNQAKKRKIDFNVTREELDELFIKQKFKCAYTDFDLSFTNNQNKGDASLDRIDSSLGYVITNVQWVHKDVNKMKWDLSHEQFLDICKIITRKING